MAESSATFTFRDLLLFVAEYYGVASYDTNGMPYIPADDAFNLRECKKIVNEAIRMFVSRPPNSGKWRWTHRVETVTFDPTGLGVSNIDSDAARYMLSAGCMQPAGRITYTSDSGHGTNIEWCDVTRILQSRELSVITGYPSLAAIRPYQPTTNVLTSSRRWEIMFDPAPSSIQSVQFPYVMQFDKMLLEGGTADSAGATTLVDATRLESDDYFNTWVIRIIAGTGVGSYAPVTDYVKSTGTYTVADWLDSDGVAGGTDPAADSIYVVEPAANLHPAGAQFDEAIKIACFAKCEMEAEDTELGNKYIKYFDEVALPAAYTIDANSAPRTLGKMHNGRRDNTNRHIRVWDNVNFNI